MPERFNKDDLKSCLATIYELTEELHRQDRQIERVAEEIEDLVNDSDEDRDYRALARRMSQWQGGQGLGYDLRKKSLPALLTAERVLRTVTSTNTIHLYEFQIPGLVHSSIGDISQFMVDLEPIE